MNCTFHPGDCVIVNDDPKLTGTVVYTRNVPPEYTRIGAVSVRLDSELWRPRYVATLFPADRVRRLDN